jgi:hypothetical protein
MTVQMATTILVPPASLLLVDLDTVKSEINLGSTDTSNDAWLTLAIGQVSRSIHSFCNRVFPIQQLQDIAYLQQDPYPYQVPGGVNPLQLSHWPLASFALLPLSVPAQIGDTALNFGPNYTAAAALPGIVSGPGLPLGSIAGTSGGTITLSQPVIAPMPAGTLVAFGIAVTQALAGGLPARAGTGAVTQGLSAAIDYQIDALNGQLVRLNPFTGVATAWEALPTTITYSAGYSTIPEDVVIAALRWMVVRWWEHTSNRDPMMRSYEQPLVGTKTYWVGGPRMSGGVPEEIADLLSHYRVPVVA